MPSNLSHTSTKIERNRLKTALFIAIFAFLTTFSSQYIFARAFLNNFWLGFGTAICAFLMVYILHYLIFQKLKTKLAKYALIAVFPPVYFICLGSFFGFATSLLNFTLFQVAFINQIYLQTLFFLGQSFFYLTFSPKLPFILTSILVILSFLVGLTNRHTQTEQD
ncbi:MAG: hypothetical protein COB24_05200 [Hyphomicrobiales bacterium]|nr:MAG: hypothetical protein COB24_05200 [Hyphomicrobiales bacterium]